MTTQSSRSDGKPDRPSANGLLAVNLVTALVAAMFLAALMVVSFGSEHAWAGPIYLLSILVSLSAATVCVWQNHLEAAVMDIIIWVITGVSLFFGFISLLVAVIIVFLGGPDFD